MTSLWKSRIEVVTNALTVLVCLAFVTVFFYNQSKRPVSAAERSQNALVGTTLQIPHFQFVANKTVVLALSTNCHYCSASAEFYRRLVPAAKAVHVPVVAVFPQSLEEAQAYLSEKSISVDSVLQTFFSDINVEATPTVILSDAKGSVISAWVGLLSPDAEKRVIARLDNEPNLIDRMWQRIAR